LSIIVIVSAGVKNTNVVCPRNETYDLCIFVIFSKTYFVDIVPLCCQPSLYYWRPASRARLWQLPTLGRPFSVVRPVVSHTWR